MYQINKPAREVFKWKMKTIETYSRHRDENRLCTILYNIIPFTTFIDHTQKRSKKKKKKRSKTFD